jgi:hypothetical protein
MMLDRKNNDTEVGAALKISIRKKYSQTHFFQCKLVDMVCRIKSHQGRFQKKSFSGVLCAFSCVFSCFAGKNEFLDVFLLVFTVVRPLLWLLDPPHIYRLFRAPIMYIYFI